MSQESERFLSRWSRRKIEAKREAAQPEPRDKDSVRAGGPVAAASVAAGAGVPDANPNASQPTTAPPAAAPLPPIESLDGLQSDYAAFFQQPVADAIKRAALRKLFSDPHFNQMDGLDVYIDDYSKFEPVEEATRLRLLGSSEFMNRIEALPDVVPVAEPTPTMTIAANDADLDEAGRAGDPEGDADDGGPSEATAEPSSTSAATDLAPAADLPATGAPIDQPVAPMKQRP
jgi:hypothetical protein